MEDDGEHTQRIDPTIIDGPSTDEGSRLVLCGRYRLSHLIGSGGMAQVWAATDTVLGREVAVKMLHAHLARDENFVTRFRAEARAAARLSHQNIVGVFDTCSDNGNEAIIMELLSATTLREHLDEHGELEVATTIRIALRVLAALEAAHQAGLVHRDVKPSNILLCDDGRVKIADFGIAKIEDQTDLTQTGSLMGTVAYLAPEQLSDGPVDGRADLYSLGIVMYECLTGTAPFKADTKAGAAVMRLHTDPVDPRRLRPGIPQDLAETIMRALERDPADRFSSTADLRAALLNAPVPATTGRVVTHEDTGELPAPPPTFSRAERNWLYPALFLVLIAGALTTIGLLWNQGTSGEGGRTTVTSPTATTAVSERVEVVGAASFDPEGDGEENDGSVANVLDDQESTAWRTEGYEPPGFSGGKTGVGLSLDLGARTTTVDRLTITGSSNGWSARVFVTDSRSLDDVDRSDGHEVGVIENFDGSATVELSGSAAQRTGSRVLVWITDLGSPADDGRYRVEVNTVQVFGHQAD